MKVVTSKQMQNIDRVSIKERGIPSLTLMERAGKGVANKIRELYEMRKVVAVCGTGNNGGDGMVASRILKEYGWDAEVIILGDVSALSKDSLVQYRMALESDVKVRSVASIKGADLSRCIIIDALFGTGLNKTVRGKAMKAISVMNRSSSPVVSVDIASGISADDGKIMGKAVKAELTVTFGLPKIGHYLYPGASHSGELYVEDIGFPRSLTSSSDIRCNIIDNNVARKFIKKRERDSHKGTYGHLLIIAGSKGRTGAAVMASRAAMRSGAGLVTLGVPESIMGPVQSRVLEEMTLSLPSGPDGTVTADSLDIVMEFVKSRADAVLIGPGLGVNEDTELLVKGILQSSNKPLILDADALNVLAGDRGIFNKARSEVVITPHPGEMGRLISGSRKKTDVPMVNSKRIEVASSFSKKNGIITVLKGAPTVISSPDGEIYLNTTGNPGMATAGSGDVLSGVIGAFMARGSKGIKAIASAVHLHGIAGDLASDIYGEWSMVAGDIINDLPLAFKLIESGEAVR